MRGFNLLPSLIRGLAPIMSRQLDDEAEKAYEKMIQNWENGQDAKGRPWTPLAAETVQRKGHGDPLIDSGDMIDSAGFEVDKDNMVASIYIDDPKIWYHELGTEKIPARPVLKPTAELLGEDMENQVGEAFDQSLGGSGGGMSSSVGLR